MSPVLSEVIDFLESWDIEPTKQTIEDVLNEWISNLYSHIGAEAHKREEALGIIDETGMSWEEQDMQMLKQIHRYKEALLELKITNKQ